MTDNNLVLSMNTKKDIFEKIAEVKEEVLLGDVVKVLRALNEDIDNVIEVKLNYEMNKVEYPKRKTSSPNLSQNQTKCW